MTKNPALLATLLLMGLLLSACAVEGKGANGEVLVTGKTIYRGMGVEGALIEASAGGKALASARSAYHGTFRIPLKPGSYTLSARWWRPGEGGETTLVTGEVIKLRVEEGVERLDKVTILLSESPGR